MKRTFYIPDHVGTDKRAMRRVEVDIPDAPTLHPDTARLDWLERRELSVWISDDDSKTIFDCLSEDLRAKIDAAMEKDRG